VSSFLAPFGYFVCFRQRYASHCSTGFCPLSSWPRRVRVVDFLTVMSLPRSRAMESLPNGSKVRRTDTFSGDGRALLVACIRPERDRPSMPFPALVRKPRPTAWLVAPVDVGDFTSSSLASSAATWLFSALLCRSSILSFQS